MISTLISELSRKAVHLLNAIIPLIHIHLIKDKLDMIIFLSATLIFSFFIELIRVRNTYISKMFKKYLFFMMRDKEIDGDLTGSTWVFAGALLTIIFVPSPFCLIALFFLAVGDTFAALIGKRYPYIHLGDKTLSGSFACLISCFTIGVLFNFGINNSVIFFGAFIATLVELISKKVNDNLSIPIFSGFSMYLINFLL